MPLIYSFSNDGFTGVSWKGGVAVTDAEGLCFGYSTIWCVKMQQFPDKPLLTKPDQFAASILQQRVEQMPGSWTNSIKKLVALSGHGCGSEISINWSLVARTIALSKGHYIIDIGDHWVAGAATSSGFSFFDANEGMTSFSSLDKFIEGVSNRLANYKNDPDLDNGWEDTHKLYNIIR